MFKNHTLSKYAARLVKLAVVGGVAASSFYANAACNEITVKTILPPDCASTVFVTLNQDDPATLIDPDYVCKYQFDTPNDTSWTLETKCRALADGITNSAQCQAAGFVVSNDSCSTLNSFTVQGTSSSEPISIGISNTGFDQNDDFQGAPLPNYEEEVLTPGCADPDPNSSDDDPAAFMAIKGDATGQSFISGQPSAVNVHVDLTNSGLGIIESRITTSPGMPAIQIAQMLLNDLNQKNIGEFAVCQVREVPIVGIFCEQINLDGSANGFGISTSDTGIFIGNAAGPIGDIEDAFNGPLSAPAVAVPFPLTAIVSFGVLIAGIGFSLLRRKR